MHVDILNGKYTDPYDRDYFSELGVEDYENDVQELCDKDLKENYNKYFKKKRANLEELDETEDEDDPTMGGKYDARRHMRKVDIGTEPWNYDQSFIWPDYEAEAFEDALDQFRQRPESNTGYLNKKLNQIMQTRWGKEQANKCIDNTLFKDRIKKESARKRFQRKLQEKLFEDEGDYPEYIIEIKNKNTGKWEHVGSELKNGKVIPSTSIHSTVKVFKSEKDALYSNLFDQLTAKGYRKGINLRITNQN